MEISKEDAPRKQHYYFAHIFLRDRAFENGERLVDRLRGESGTNYLKFLWTERGVVIARNENEEFIPPDGLKCSPVEIGSKYYGALVELPEPKRMAEAIYVAILSPVNAESSSRCHFFTFEFSLNEDGSPGAVLGEWSPGIHSSLSKKATPGKEGFLDALRELMTHESDTKIQI